MIPTWYNTPARVAILEAEALSWDGTPWGQNSMVKGPGGGASCQMLAGAVHVATKCLAEFAIPPAPMGWGRHNKTSLIEPFMDGLSSFAPVPTDEMPLPGDVLGFKIDGCVHHMGVMLDRGLFLHVWRTRGVMRSLLADPTYSKRLQRIWRPLP